MASRQCSIAARCGRGSGGSHRVDHPRVESSTSVAASANTSRTQSGGPVPEALTCCQRPSLSTRRWSVSPPAIVGNADSTPRTGKPKYPNQNRSGRSGGARPGRTSIDGAMTASASHQSPTRAAGGGDPRRAVATCSVRSRSVAVGVNASPHTGSRVAARENHCGLGQLGSGREAVVDGCELSIVADSQ